MWCIGLATFFPVTLCIIFQTLEGVLTLTEDTWFFQESCFFCLNNFLVLAWIKCDLIEFAALGYLLANLLALFHSFLAAWQSSSNQGLAFLFRNGEVLGILSAAISSNVLENIAILSSASWNRLGVISWIHWSWNISHFAFLKFHFGTLSGTGWSDVFAVIIIGWWSLPNLSDKTSHATSMCIEGWHKDRARSWFDDKYRTKYEQNHLTKSDYGCLLSVQQPYHVHSLD